MCGIFVECDGAQGARRAVAAVRQDWGSMWIRTGKGSAYKKSGSAGRGGSVIQGGGGRGELVWRGRRGEKVGRNVAYAMREMSAGIAEGGGFFDRG
eukprot:COSAG02_NODE_7300_length_3076_cov_11.715821_1_plen_96_part_00